MTCETSSTPSFVSSQMSSLFGRSVRILIPVVVSVTLFVVVFTSEVPPNLYVLRGTAALVPYLIYATVMAWIAVRPNFLELHLVGGPLAVLVFLGRAGGFIELGIARETFELSGAVAERVLLCALLVSWHWVMVTIIPPRVRNKHVASTTDI